MLLLRRGRRQCLPWSSGPAGDAFAQASRVGGSLRLAQRPARHGRPSRGARRASASARAYRLLRGDDLMTVSKSIPLTVRGSVSGSSPRSRGPASAKVGPMCAQLVQGGTTPGLRRNEMDRIVRDELLPALAHEAGYAGALNLVDRETGDAITLMLVGDPRARGAPAARARGPVPARAQRRDRDLDRQPGPDLDVGGQRTALTCRASRTAFARSSCRRLLPSQTPCIQ
jgi:hypothetical protein